MPHQCRFIRLLAFAVIAAALPAWPAEPLTLDALLAGVKSDDANQRRAAWEQAGPVGAAAVASLAELIAAGNRNDSSNAERDVAKAAVTALVAIGHHASRPDAPEERKAVSAELAKLLGAGRNEAVRIKALELLGSTDQGESVDAIAALFRDPDRRMRERARAALERIPGDSANRALIAALESSDIEFQRDLILTLGHKKSKEATDVLLKQVQSADPRIQMAAVGALASIGDARAREAIIDVLRAMEGPARRMATDRYLRLADNLAASDPDAAARMYRGALRYSKDDPVRIAALIGLGKMAGPEIFNVLLENIGDPSIKIGNAASDALIGMKADDVNQRLADATPNAQPGAKAMLLRVLAQRAAPQAADLLKQAAQDPNAEVRVTALSLLGNLDDPALEKTLLEAAESGSGQVRPIALANYLNLADKRAQQDKAAALAMYNRALDLAGENVEIARRALAGIGATGGAESLERIEKLARASGPAQADAVEAYVSILASQAKGGDVKNSIGRLTAIVSEPGVPPRVVARAIAILDELGADTSGFSARAGFLASWLILGPIPIEASAEIESARAIDPAQPVKIGDKTYEWKKFQSKDPQAIVNLREVFPDAGDNVAVYAATEIAAPRRRSITLLMGSDDGVTAWLNGQKVHDNPGANRPVEADQDRAEARIERGPNLLLLKVLQNAGEWGYVVRIGNPQGRPLDLTRWGEEGQ